jgi:hypothetical protein
MIMVTRLKKNEEEKGKKWTLLEKLYDQLTNIKFEVAAHSRLAVSFILRIC